VSTKFNNVPIRIVGKGKDEEKGMKRKKCQRKLGGKKKR